MTLTTDTNDPRLGHGGDEKPGRQNEVYLVLSDEERAKGFVRPVRCTYRHIGPQPKHPLRDLTTQEKALYGDFYQKFEPFPDGKHSAGRFWSQEDLDNNGCGTTTKIALEIAETYARSPHFYGYTYCCHCGKHLPVSEFVWCSDGAVVGS